jgi:hypothetical protein
MKRKEVNRTEPSSSVRVPCRCCSNKKKLVNAILSTCHFVKPHYNTFSEGKADKLKLVTGALLGKAGTGKHSQHFIFFMTYKWVQ